MASMGSIDPASPYFATIAGQATVQSGAAKASGNKKKEKTGIRSFAQLVSSEAVASETVDTSAIPERLIGLAPEKILEALLDDVHSSGDRLKGSQLPDNIVAYKNAVRSFMKYIVASSYTVIERTSGGNILKRKKFTQVQIIDEKLEQLAAGILSNQKDQLGLLGKIEEINGLLVDLMS
jgi:uncharacterized protein YaaR (DUF327 family)